LARNALGLDPRVAEGTPEDIVKVKRSYTGQFLKPVLERREKPRKRIQAAE
jgi:excinuclease ABC subunit A